MCAQVSGVMAPVALIILAKECVGIDLGLPFVPQNVNLVVFEGKFVL